MCCTLHMSSFPSFGIINRIISFSQFELIFEIKAGHISFSLIYKILIAIVGLFFSKIAQSSIFDRYFIPFPIYLLINGLISKTVSVFHSVFHFLYNLMETLRHIENIYHCNFSGLLLLFSFLVQFGELIYEPRRLKFTL